VFALRRGAQHVMWCECTVQPNHTPTHPLNTKNNTKNKKASTMQTTTAAA
jgi:hypothetical protein